MLGYYLDLSIRSIRRHKVLSALMMVTVALGISTSITMLTVLHNLSGNPLPQRSDVLFHPQVDPRPLNLPGASDDPPDDLTYVDATSLFQLGIATRRIMTSSNVLPVRADVDGSSLSMTTVRATTGDFFAMFDVPFIRGGGWTASDDDHRAQVVVLTRTLNEKLFGGDNSIGRTIVVATKTFRVIGVIDDWNPRPQFYDLNGSIASGGAYGDSAQLYLPFYSWLEVPQDYGYGPMRCWGDPVAGDHNPKAPKCTWVQFWAQLDSPAQVSDYRAALKQYSQQQHQLGRFERESNVRLLRLMEWLDYKHVVPAVVPMQTYIAFGVFLICMVNTVGLLIAKFVRKSGEIGLRRALGASRKDVFIQCLVESGVVGAAGGAASLPLTWLGVWMVRQQPVNFASSIHLDLSMLSAALLLAIAATLAAGTWPAWRAANLTPALQVKSL
ncbi:MAG: ABC transporter permease [Dyella sp.]|uniref:ABC transporter permease n=1 Tax=Dyella sp. TaxID=1869338 RepID=UPI003F81E295